MIELKRVLKKTGSCWVNLGDTYAGGNAHSDWNGFNDRFDIKRKTHGKFKSIMKKSIKSKSLHLIPFEFAVNCRDAGWIVRNVIPWYKENSMPCSIKDRFANKWEPIFFMTKNKRYYFNLNAARVKSRTETKPFNIRVREAPKGRYGTLYQWTEQEIEKHNKKGERKQDTTLGADGKPKPTYVGFNERWKKSKTFQSKENPEHYTDMMKRKQELRDQGADHDGAQNHPDGKNPGDVFFINPYPFPEAHFATFPVELPLTILRPACPPKVCAHCGYPDMLNNPIIQEPDANTNGEELLQAMQERDTNEGRPLSETSVLFKDMPVQVDRETQTTQDKKFTRLHNDMDRWEVSTGTQIDNGKAVRSEVTKDGSSTSHQRNKDRQQIGKSSINEGSRSQSSSKTSKKTNTMSSLSQMDAKRWTCKKCGSHDSHPGVVLDCFFGAGTVGVAAEELALNWIGIELKEEYIKIARKRLEPYMMKRLA